MKPMRNRTFKSPKCYIAENCKACPYFWLKHCTGTFLGDMEREQKNE